MPLLDVLGMAKPVVKIETQIAPSFSLNLEPQAQPTPQPGAKPGLASKLSDFFLRSIVKPKIIVESNGIPVKKYAPYGEPTQNLGLPLVLGIGIGVIGFGAASYYFCKSNCD